MQGMVPFTKNLFLLEPKLTSTWTFVVKYLQKIKTESI